MDIIEEKLEKLILDPDNDRFAELYSGSKKEEDLIEYLLYVEAAQDVAKNIVDRGEYYSDEVLWVIRQDNKLLIKDGNRRCAAVKALQNPKAYDLGLPKLIIDKLPVIIYEDIDELERRVKEQHTHSFFKSWDSIAKALKAYEMHNSGFSEEAIKEIDSSPARLIKLASFYYAAVKIGGEDFKQLLRRGRGPGKGKTIIFERLFKYSRSCGYKFKKKPSYEIDIFDKQQFEKYIIGIINYLKNNPKTNHTTIDNDGSKFLDKLIDFKPIQGDKSDGTKQKSQKLPKQLTYKGVSIQKYPEINRSLLPPQLNIIIKECYDLDHINFANSKMALSRVLFEAILKYVVSETKHNGKKLSNYKYFESAFKNKKTGDKLKYTNFTELKTLFIKLIIDTGSQNAFKSFDLDKLHQIIHNYKVGAVPGNAEAIANNLIPLIEFMLDDSNVLIQSLDSSKLK